MHIEAIVIRKRPLREHDQLVVLYSRELGKLGALAKGSLRRASRQALALDEGSTISCELMPGRVGPIITGAVASRGLSGAKRSPVAWAAVQFFLQAVDVIVFDGQPDASLWSCLAGILDEIDASRDDELLYAFRTGQRKLLASLGYGRPPDAPTERWGRTETDERFEAIAQRRLPAIDLLCDVAAMSRT